MVVDAAPDGNGGGGNIYRLAGGGAAQGLGLGEAHAALEAGNVWDPRSWPVLGQPVTFPSHCPPCLASLEPQASTWRPATARVAACASSWASAWGAPVPSSTSSTSTSSRPRCVGVWAHFACLRENACRRMDGWGCALSAPSLPPWPDPPRCGPPRPAPPRPAAGRDAAGAGAGGHAVLCVQPGRDCGGGGAQPGGGGVCGAGEGSCSALCRAVLRCAVPCRAVLRCAMLCCAVPRRC